MDNRGLRTVCGDGDGCQGLGIGQKFWGEAYLERGFCIGLDYLRSCDLGVTASGVNVLDVEWGFADGFVLLGIVLRVPPILGAFRSEFVAALGTSSAGGWLPVVDEEDNKSRDQQRGDNDGCEDCAFGHG